jgi:hypothetical protein
MRFLVVRQTAQVREVLKFPRIATFTAKSNGVPQGHVIIADGVAVGIDGRQRLRLDQQLQCSYPVSGCGTDIFSRTASVASTEIPGHDEALVFVIDVRVAAR